MQTLDFLNNRFGIPGTLRFESGAGNLIRAAVTTPVAEAHVYLHGAHVTHFQPRGQRPVLFLSAKSWFAAGQPIRGGVPICFPWFGPKKDDPAAPAHGTARIREWTVEAVAPLADGAVRLTLALAPARFRVTVGAALTMELVVENTSAAPFTFEEALHTYLAVSHAHAVSVTGLGGVDYLDKTDGLKRKTQAPEPLRITGETNRIYLNTQSTCVVVDSGWGRQLSVEKSGSDVTVVWNPWTTQSPSLPDFGGDEWPRMLCIETGNITPQPVSLAPGRVHTLTAVVRAKKTSES